MIPEVALRVTARLGEGPVWDPRSSTLRWVDIERGEVHRFDPASGMDTFFEVGEAVGTFAGRAAGGHGQFDAAPGGGSDLGSLINQRRRQGQSAEALQGRMLRELAAAVA